MELNSPREARSVAKDFQVLAKTGNEGRASEGPGTVDEKREEEPSTEREGVFGPILGHQPSGQDSGTQGPIGVMELNSAREARSVAKDFQVLAKSWPRLWP